jgi:hypothetical protein
MAERSGPPEPHASFLRAALARLREDPRLVGVGAGGSYLAGTMDEFSDLALARHGARASGVRRLELLAPEPAAEMRATIAAYDARSCALALGRVVEMYRRLRRALAAETLVPRAEAEKTAVAYLDEVSWRVAP